MTKRVTSRRRGSYGIDAPFALAFMVLLLVVEIVLGIISGSVKPFVAALFILAITTRAAVPGHRRTRTWSGTRPLLGRRSDDKPVGPEP